MKTPNFHLPHWGFGHGQSPSAEHHHRASLKKLWRLENAMDFVVVVGGMLLAAAMIYGLLTASGDTPWLAP